MTGNFQAMYHRTEKRDFVGADRREEEGSARRVRSGGRSGGVLLMGEGAVVVVVMQSRSRYATMMLEGAGEPRPWLARTNIIWCIRALVTKEPAALTSRCNQAKVYGFGIT